MSNPTIEQAPAVDSPEVVREIVAGEGLSLSQAARLLPHGRGDAPTSPSALWRWARHGVRGPDGSNVRLEVARVGCRTFTSRSALARFLSRLNPTQPAPTPASGAPPQPRQPRSRGRARAVQAAQDELARLGL
jgi:hypothetical protein